MKSSLLLCTSEALTRMWSGPGTLAGPETCSHPLPAMPGCSQRLLGPRGSPPCPVAMAPLTSGTPPFPGILQSSLSTALWGGRREGATAAQLQAAHPESFALSIKKIFLIFQKTINFF